MMQTDYAKEALETTAIVFRNGSPHMMRLDYPPGTWEGMIRAAHLSKTIDCVFIMDGTPDAERLLAQRQEILERNAEPSEVDEILVDLSEKDAELASVKETNAELLKRLDAQQAQINQLLARGLAEDTPPVTTPKPPAPPVDLTEDMLKAMEIHELRSMAVSFQTPGSGTKEDLITRILGQQAAGIAPK